MLAAPCLSVVKAELWTLEAKYNTEEKRREVVCYDVLERRERNKRALSCVNIPVIGIISLAFENETRVDPTEKIEVNQALASPFFYVCLWRKARRSICVKAVDFLNRTVKRMSEMTVRFVELFLSEWKQQSEFAQLRLASKVEIRDGECSFENLSFS